MQLRAHNRLQNSDLSEASPYLYINGFIVMYIKMVESQSFVIISFHSNVYGG